MTEINARQIRVPPQTELPAFLQELHCRYQPLRDGAAANYIPKLANANPEWFGISVVTADGQAYSVGDTSVLFTIQSISKPFVYGLVLEDWGSESVREKIGIEPTGDPFNATLASEEIEERKYNPMINAGAIATTSLIKGANQEERQRRLFGMFERYLGRRVEIDQSVFDSRQATDSLNRAIAYIMLNFGRIEGKIEEILDLYFQQCSLRVDCGDLALMAATLANAGINPVTGQQAIASRTVKNLLSIMYTCGLYDFSGQWAYRVGLPAKSGLSGALIAVVPGQMGIAVYSPPLGEHKKSLRGVKVLEALSRTFGLHIFDKAPLGQGLEYGVWGAGRNRPEVKDTSLSVYRQENDETETAEREILDNSLSPPYFQGQSPLPPVRSALDEVKSSHQGETGDRTFFTNPSLGVPSQSIGAASTMGSNITQGLTAFLNKLYDKYLPLRDGKIYTSEPNLVEINPDWFAICAVTGDGQVFSVGDWDQPFLIQSISKVFAYGLALEDCGRDQVLRKVDVEPTGDAYDSIIKVEENSKRPYNPMVNTGAIAITSLIAGREPAHKLNRVLEMYRRYIGHRVFIDTPTVVSEQTQGDRNWAISYLLRNFGTLSGDIKQILDLYLQQCSVLVNCQDLAVMGATLANHGTNPMTGERAIHPDYVRDLLSVMFTCGMYDFAGEWAYEVGFPAKSGVGGGIIAVVPGLMGIAVFSPPLDKRGNSVRGIKVCKELSGHFGLNIFEPT